jgi:glycosyltransferase involved in cell wall biosynthesis
LDFRDLWDNQVVTTSYKPTFKKNIQDQLVKYHWKKWLRGSDFFTTTSSKWTDYLEQMSNNKGFVIPNGHEIREVNHPQVQNEFKLTYFGRIYPNQNLELLIEGIKRFIKTEQPAKFKLLLIGIKKTADFDGLQLITDTIDSRYIKIIDYLPKEQLLEYCRNESSMFFLPSFKEDNGQFMVKLYDFIALGKPVIIAPKVNSDMEYVVEKSNAGVTADGEDAIASYLGKQYKHFLKMGYAKSDLKSKLIMQYHRQNQIKKMADFIKAYL